MDARVLHRETIVDKRKKPVNIEFTICGENDAHIFYMQPLNLARKEVEYDDLDGLIKGTLVQILVKFHHHDGKALKKKLKEELIQCICRLHGITIHASNDKLNMCLEDRLRIAATVKAEANQILIILQEYAEQDELYSNVPHLLATYTSLCSQEQYMEIFEKCITMIFLHFVEEWAQNETETGFLAKYRQFQSQIYQKDYAKTFGIDLVQELFDDDLQTMEMPFKDFMYGVIILVKKLVIKLVRLTLGDYLLGIHNQTHDMFKAEFTKDESLYFGTCFLGSSITSYLRTVHAVYKDKKQDILLILDRMLLKYDSIDELSKHNVSPKLLKENDGFLRIVKNEFIEWSIEILNTASVGLKEALIKHHSLARIINKCQSNKILQHFEIIFDAMDVMDEEKDEISDEPIDYGLLKDVGLILARKQATRMIWAMLRDKKNDAVAEKIKAKAKILHLSKKRLELCKN
eukprot:728267_1